MGIYDQVSFYTPLAQLYCYKQMTVIRWGRLFKVLLECEHSSSLGTRNVPCLRQNLSSAKIVICKNPIQEILLETGAFMLGM